MKEYFVSRGGHREREEGMCALEFVSWLAGENHSDRPECVCPELAKFLRFLNDGMCGVDRQRLRPFLARAIGTSADGLEGERRRLWSLWLTQVARFGGAREKDGDMMWNTLDWESVDAAFTLLEEMLPTEVLQVPVVEEWREVCQTPEAVAA